jgi:hypothetical protein
MMRAYREDVAALMVERGWRRVDYCTHPDDATWRLGCHAVLVRCGKSGLVMAMHALDLRSNAWHRIRSEHDLPSLAHSTRRM